MEGKFLEILTAIEEAKRIVLVSHVDPDGDTVGSCLAMAGYLGGIGKDYVLVCGDRLDERFDFLEGYFNYQLFSEMTFLNGDVVFALDVAGVDMLGGEVLVPIVNIDHHASNAGIGFLNFVDASAASVTVLIYEFLKFVRAPITAEMATALLLGIYTDTGSFMHSNTDSRSFLASSALLACGARLEEIVRRFFRSRSLSALKILGRALLNARLTDDNVVVSEINEEDFVEACADPSDLSGVIDYLNMIPDARYALLMNRDKGGIVKGSLRTRSDDVDVAKIAKTFGGGGHSKASGFTVKGEEGMALKSLYPLLNF